MNTQSVVLVEYEKALLSKAKSVLYLVLKKKDWIQELIDQVNQDLEIRFQNFIQQISLYLENSKLKNNEIAVKCIMLKGVVNILNKMMEERLSILSDEDKILINDAFSTQNIIEPKQNEDNNNKIKEKIEKKEKKGKSRKKDHNNNNEISKTDNSIFTINFFNYSK